MDNADRWWIDFTMSALLSKCWWKCNHNWRSLSLFLTPFPPPKNVLAALRSIRAEASTCQSIPRNHVEECGKHAGIRLAIAVLRPLIFFLNSNPPGFLAAFGLPFSLHYSFSVPRTIVQVGLA